MTMLSCTICRRQYSRRRTHDHHPQNARQRSTQRTAHLASGRIGTVYYIHRTKVCKHSHIHTRSCVRACVRASVHHKYGRHRLCVWGAVVGNFAAALRTGAYPLNFHLGFRMCVLTALLVVYHSKYTHINVCIILGWRRV